MIQKDEGRHILPRSLSPQERNLIEFLFSDEFPGRDELKVQLEHAEVIEEYPDDDPSIVIRIQRESSPPAPVKRRIPIEARGFAHGGIDINVLLHVDKGYIHELEVYRDNLEPVALPNPSELQLFDLHKEPPMEDWESWLRHRAHR